MGLWKLCPANGQSGTGNRKWTVFHDLSVNCTRNRNPFFKQYISAAVYTSFFFAIAFGICLYFLFQNQFGSQSGQKLLLLVFVCPFSYKLFLPSPASIICFLLALAVFSIHIKLPKVNLKISCWSYQFLLVILTSINIMLYYKEMLLRK